MDSICFIQFTAFKVGENSLLLLILVNYLFEIIFFWRKFQFIGGVHNCFGEISNLSANWKLSLIFSNYKTMGTVPMFNFFMKRENRPHVCCQLAGFFT